MTTRAGLDAEYRAEVDAWVAEFVKNMSPLSESKINLLRELAESDPPLPSQRRKLVANQ
ncbi:hypothetical protein RW1_040_00340 [Rhodococcus wratislaviensis NBRC 100605]|uniref:Uncharacterized protein n=1 Tax=Rhodococcus wratislaviensis NBRC 100605 TaxID=1219028 RepID=X0Q7F6_RHOWR|nr:hypothetical protein RW1_040_00340 [Rhodococcus wratislaviensis NBRC 100605]